MSNGNPKHIMHDIVKQNRIRVSSISILLIKTMSRPEMFLTQLLTETFTGPICEYQSEYLGMKSIRTLFSAVDTKLTGSIPLCVTFFLPTMFACWPMFIDVNVNYLFFSSVIYFT